MDHKIEVISAASTSAPMAPTNASPSDECVHSEKYYSIQCSGTQAVHRIRARLRKSFMQHTLWRMDSVHEKSPHFRCTVFFEAGIRPGGFGGVAALLEDGYDIRTVSSSFGWTLSIRWRRHMAFRDFVAAVHGVVSTGAAWKFLRLQGDLVMMDTPEYFIDNLPKIMGILRCIVEAV